MIDQQPITYEQPSNESMRLCLRLEYLLQQLHWYLSKSHLHDSDIAVFALVKILDVLARPDLKSKLTQMMSQCLSMLTKLKEAPEVDETKLDTLLESVQELIDQLHQTPGKIAERLGGHSFFNQVRSHLYNAWGTAHFSTPSYMSWLQQPADVRIADLKSWAEEFHLLERVVSTVLKITRETATPKKVNAAGGVYQQALNPNMPCQLIRIGLNLEKLVYPEISVGKHRFVIRFLTFDMGFGTRPQKFEEDVSCILQCCYFLVLR